MKITYDRQGAGGRLRLKRTLLGLTQEEIAEKIGRATKYYADIERGSCGMSVETLMALATVLNMSMEYIIYGSKLSEEPQHTDETLAVLSMLDSSGKRDRKYAMNILKLFLAACDIHTNVMEEGHSMEEGLSMKEGSSIEEVLSVETKPSMETIPSVEERFSIIRYGEVKPPKVDKTFRDG